MDFFAGPTAASNMHHDTEAIQALLPETSRVRVYQWLTPGITYGWKQSLSAVWQGWDAAIRPTGGGLVFHCPGDIVFSVCDWRSSWFRSKAVLLELTCAVSMALSQTGIRSEIGQEMSGVDYAYCKTYPTPFELTVASDKVLGLTMRLFRDRYLIQGIIHVGATREWFGSVEAGRPYFTAGLSLSGTQVAALKQLLIQNLEDSPQNSRHSDFTGKL